jgi:FkbM family methyltransferase
MNFEIFETLKRAGFSPRCIVDGGANVGQWSRSIREIFPEARVVAIEGNDECLPHLNEFDYEMSLIGDTEGNVKFFVSTDSKFATGNSTLKECTHYYRPDNSIEKLVRMRRLESVLAERQISSVDVLKLDLQGAELKALRGLGTFIKKTEFILFEASLVEYNLGQPLFADIHKFLDDNGFVCFDVTEQHRLAGISFQMDFMYVRKGSSFRPLFSTAREGVCLGARQMLNWTVGSHAERQDVIDDILKRKSKGPCTVIDIGGSFNGWSMPVLDALIDINLPKEMDRNIAHFRIDINDRDGWALVLEYVEKNGKFDFSICSHTLEDIRDPVFACEMISAISKEGFVAVPSKYRELSRFELGPNYYRGYIHHRWIYTVKDGRFVGIPKLNVIDFLSKLDSIADFAEHKNELRFYWYNSIPLNIVNDDYMGPDAQAVISYFDLLLSDDLDPKN